MVEFSLIDAPITTDPELKRRVNQADRWVREALGEYEAGKNITWKLAPGRPSDDLTFQIVLDSDGRSVTTTLTSEELDDPREVRWKANQLWGQLTGRILHDRFQTVTRLLGELQEELAGGR